MTIEVTENTFEQTIGNGIVLLDFLGGLVRPVPRVRTDLRACRRCAS